MYDLDDDTRPLRRPLPSDVSLETKKKIIKDAYDTEVAFAEWSFNYSMRANDSQLINSLIETNRRLSAKLKAIEDGNK